MPAKRYSTTQKVSAWMIPILESLIDFCWPEADGFIVRLHGEEIAIVGILGNTWFVPCQKCHPGMGWVSVSEVTIRKGLV